MSREKQIEIIRDLLVEFDEMGFVPSTTVPNHEAYAIKWRAEITKALEEYFKQSEGEWKKFQELYPRYVCTACNHLFNNKSYKYCPNCGAKMKGGE